MIYLVQIRLSGMDLNLGFEYLFPQNMDFEIIENRHFPHKILLNLFIFYLFFVTFDNLPN